MSEDTTRTRRPSTGHPSSGPPAADAAPGASAGAAGRTGAVVAWKLMIGPTPTTWQLHEDEDPENVAARLESAGEHGEAVVKVHVPEATGAVLLHVRPGRSSWWTLVEVLDAGS